MNIDTQTAKEKSELMFAKTTLDLMKKGPKIHYNKGDLVRVFEGDLKSLIGEVQMVEGDFVHIVPRHKDLLNQVLPIPYNHLQRYFREGDHIIVREGKHAGETGMIVSLDDATVVVLSDIGKQELRLLITDIQKSTAVSTGAKLGEFSLYDLVSLGPHNCGVIVRIEPECAHIMEENGKTRAIKLQGIKGKKDSKKTLGRDSDGTTIGKGDAVRVIEGPNQNRKGIIKHIYKFFVYIHNREIAENNGIFVVKGKQCKLQGHSQNSMKSGHNLTNRQKN